MSCLFFLRARATQRRMTNTYLGRYLRGYSTYHGRRNRHIAAIQEKLYVGINTYIADSVDTRTRRGYLLTSNFNIHPRLVHIRKMCPPVVILPPIIASPIKTHNHWLTLGLVAMGVV